MEVSENRSIKLGIVGNSAVGKTSLIVRVAENKFIANISAGIAIDFRSIRNYKIDDQFYNLNIYDIAGLAKNNDLAISFIKDASALILAFSIPEREYYSNADQTTQTFQEQLTYWIKKINDNSAQNISVLIVGCRLDEMKDEKIFQLIDEQIAKTIENLKSEVQISFILNSKKKLNFFPTSSKTGEGITELFKLWAREGRKLIFPAGSKLNVKNTVTKTTKCC